MRSHKNLKYSLWIVGFFLGFVGWNFGIYGRVLLICVPVLWLKLPNRIRVFEVMNFYYIGATLELFFGMVTFFDGNFMKSICFWLIQVFVLASGWMFFWKKNVHNFYEILGRISGSIIVTTCIAPYSFLGIAHPLNSVGLFFPGLHWVGVGLFIVTISLMCFLFSSQYLFKHKIKRFLIVILCIVVISNVVDKSEISQGMTLHLGEYPTNLFDKYNRHLFLKDVAQRNIESDENIIVFPEMIAGVWRKSEGAVWEDIHQYAQKHDAIVFLGVQNIIAPSRYENALIVLGQKDLVSKSMLTARLPMPIGNWKPWTDWSAVVDVNFNSNVNILGIQTAVLFCYELMLVFPVLQSMLDLNQPHQVLFVSNLWWAKSTHIPKIMDESLYLWSRLFSLPVIRSVNL